MCLIFRFPWKQNMEQNIPSSLQLTLTAKYHCHCMHEYEQQFYFSLTSASSFITCSWMISSVFNPLVKLCSDGTFHEASFYLIWSRHTNVVSDWWMVPRNKKLQSTCVYVFVYDKTTIIFWCLVSSFLGIFKDGFAAMVTCSVQLGYLMWHSVWVFFHPVFVSAIFFFFGTRSI